MVGGDVKESVCEELGMWRAGTQAEPSACARALGSGKFNALPFFSKHGVLFRVVLVSLKSAAAIVDGHK